MTPVALAYRGCLLRLRACDLPPDNRALWPREFRLQGGQVGTHPESNRLANYAV